MTTKSQHHHNKDDEVHRWFLDLKRNPNNEKLQEQIVFQYEDLVKAIAKKYAKNATIHEDLIQVGMVGLMAAIKRYDPTLGKTFESFAIPTILGEIKRYIRDKTWSVHVPRRIKELSPKIKKAVEQLTNELQTSPSIKDIADFLKVSEEEVLEAMEMGQSYHALSFDRKLEADSNGGEVTIMDLIGSQDEGYKQVDFKLLLGKLMPLLSEQERKILRCTFFQGMSQKETGEHLGISQMHVSRLQRRALLKLRDALQSESPEVLF
ncbi:RNA polymerase sigma factor SigB [Salirhabdus sp. Marseille-P4669]|uniref:RNA polymerase sigma factor SigB n=1 Tax=Salirhabdus sp. Marseille-P4669 TaxID=2042310 RepID=UPI000C79B855|nr:RNA polymerase sigma factor SigB [Salirhabdus sp. Marseille-P4669]